MVKTLPNSRIKMLFGIMSLSVLLLTYSICVDLKRSLLKEELTMVNTALHVINDPILETNSSQYTWTGNHFVPPKGVPTFTPSEHLSYFQKRSTLFIGDSTGRRAYGTMFGIMNSSDFTDVQVTDIDHRDVIDFNKPFSNNRQERCDIAERGLAMVDFGIKDSFFVCRNLVSPRASRSLRNAKQNSNSVKQQYARNSGKFDFIRINCFRDIVNLFFNGSTILNLTIAEAFGDYDLVVITTGLWEGVKPAECGMKDNTANGTRLVSNMERYDFVLDAMVKVSSPDLQVVFRTPGFHHKFEFSKTTWELINHLKHRSEQLNTNGDHDPSINLTLVDWGTVMSKRSLGDKRIFGDVAAHYGLEARLLFAQQLLHEMLASEQRLSKPSSL